MDDSARQILTPEQPLDRSKDPRPPLNEFDPYFDNCYAEPGKKPKKKLDPSKVETKVQQVGQPLQTGEEYENELRAKTTRGRPEDSDGDRDSETQRKKQKKGGSPKKKRGRKDKLIEGIEDDDMALLEAETARKHSTIVAEEAKDNLGSSAQDEDKTENDH